MLELKALGATGESIVSDYLREQGFVVVQRNYQTRRGEVDIIATKDEFVVFVEVKTRRNKYFPLSQTVTPLKQKRIARAAQQFIISHQIHDKVFRFDIATVLISHGKLIIEYIPNAFMAQQ